MYVMAHRAGDLGEVPGSMMPLVVVTDYVALKGTHGMHLSASLYRRPQPAPYEVDHMRRAGCRARDISFMVPT